MANKKSQERELAAQLFIHTNITQKELAERLGVNEKTISAWANEDNWNKLKTASKSSNIKIISDLRLLLEKQLERNKTKQEEETFTKADADTILELARAIETLEGDVPLRTRIQVMEEFMDFIPHDKTKFKTEVADFQMQYLINKAR